MDVRRDGNEVRVGVSVSGDGYGGGGPMTFTLDGDRIARMVITGERSSVAAMSSAEHAAHNAMDDAEEIARFHDRCSELMRQLLNELAAAPDLPRPFPEIEDAVGWPRRRIASVLGGVCHLRQMEFGGRRPYRFLDTRHSASGAGKCGWTARRRSRSARPSG